VKGDQCCGNCRFWRSSGAQDGYCRARPPVVLTRGQDSPETRGNDWCGEWVAENPQTVDLGVLALARAVLAGDLAAGRALADKVIEMGVPEGQ